MRTILNTRGLVIAVAALALLAAACSSSEDEPATGGVKIVATTTMLGDVARNIVGEDGTVQVLFPTGASPHDYQPSSSEVAAIYEADLVVANGLNLEESLTDVLHTAHEDGVEVIEVAPLLDPEMIGTREPCDVDAHADEADHITPEDDHDDQGDHADEHDDHGACDPHVWFDPDRDATTATIIADALGAIDPTKDWSGRAAGYGEDLAAADAEIVATLEAIAAPDRMLVTNHDSFGYFAERYGFEVVGTVIPGGSSVSDPSSAELVELVEVINETGVSAIFTDTTEPKALANAIAREVDHEVVVIPLYTGSLGDAGSGADTLIGMLMSNADRIVEGLA